MMRVEVITCHLLQFKEEINKFLKLCDKRGWKVRHIKYEMRRADNCVIAFIEYEDMDVTKEY